MTENLYLCHDTGVCYQGDSPHTLRGFGGPGIFLVRIRMEIEGNAFTQITILLVAMYRIF